MRRAPGPRSGDASRSTEDDGNILVDPIAFGALRRMGQYCRKSASSARERAMLAASRVRPRAA